MDPYAIFTYQDKKQTSTIMDEAGKTPKWTSQYFDFQIQNTLDQIKMDIMDKDVLTSDTVGTALLNIDDLIIKGGTDEWHEIYYKKKSSGKIRLIANWHPSEESKKQQDEPVKKPTIS